MTAKQIREIQGKTIEEAAIEPIEASDGCWYASLHLQFTDGSSYEMKLTPHISVDGIFFKSSADDDTAKEVQLVKP